MRFLDSCICIDLMRGQLPYGYQALKTSDPRMFAIPSVVEAELRTGALKSSNPTKSLLILDKFLMPFEVIPFDSLCAKHYGRIRTSLEQAGKRIGWNDLLIAATAVAHGAVLVTNNVREFKRIPELSLESWYEGPLD